MAPESDLPERPKEGNDAAPAGPSKSALKKAQKEKEKAEKAAKRAAEEAERKAAAAASDTSKHLYGFTVPDEKLGGAISLDSLDESHVDKTVTIIGRVYNSRVQSAKLAFIDLRQRLDNIQVVIAERPTISRQMVKFCGGLNREALVLIEAKVVKAPEPIKSATVQDLELQLESCYIMAQAPEQLPLQIRDAQHAIPTDEAEGEGAAQVDAEGRPVVGMKTLLDNRTLSLRTPTNQAIFSINSTIQHLYSDFMFQNGFTQINTPKIAGAATEGGADVFSVDYFKTPAFLTQSPQFYKQMAIAADLGRVFEIGPVFRAENSNTARHLTEFTGLDFEMPISKSWTEVLDVAEALVLYIFQGLNSSCKREMATIQTLYPHAGDFKIPSGPAPRIRFADGIKMLHEAGVTEASPDEDISTAHEKLLGKLVREKYGTDFYFLTHYPVAARPFYTRLDPEDPTLTLSYDAFMRAQEIVSGAQRVHVAEELKERMRSKGIDPSSEGFKHYVEAFELGCGPHGGGGFGLNRILMLWLGLPNIRQATLFPRDPQRKFP
jgi:aspartyl-tRNA synthetase